jgi:general secretion pathway protein D
MKHRVGCNMLCNAIARGRTSRRILAVMLVSLTVLGCAADRLHRQGLELISEGQVDEGLAKLEAAARKEPDNLRFRTDLLQKRGQVTQRLLISADAERIAGRGAAAGQIYQRVLKIDSENPRAKAGLANLEMDQRHATALALGKDRFDRHDLEGAQSVLRAVLLENPTQSEARSLQRKIDEQIAKDAMAGPTLKAEFKKPVSLQFRDANLKMVVEALSRSNDLNILIDRDVKSDLKTTIFVKEASVEDTIDLILLQNQLEKKILSDNTIFIYPSNPAKIKEYQDLMIRSFHLTNADAKQMEAMIKTLLKTRDLYVDEKTNSLVMRDTPDAIRLAEKLIAAQDLAEPEVMLEVEVLEITRSRLTELGVKLPGQIGLSASGIPATTTQTTTAGGAVVTTTTPAQPLTLETLKDLDGSMIKVSPLNATIDLRHETGNANILASPRIRVRNREKAKIHIGDRLPVITNAVTPVATGAPVVTGSVQYLDVGLKLDVEPDIHLDDDVAIKLTLEVSNIVREVSSGPTLAYQVGTRSANTVLRLRDGETQVLAGLISDEDRRAAQKFPGLGQLPVLGRLFSSHKDDARKTEIVLSITPHLTRTNQRAEARNLEFWSGTDSALRSRPLALQASAATGQTGGTLPKANGRPAAAPSPPAAATPAPPPPPTGGATDNADRSGQPIVLSWQGPTEAKVGGEFQVVVEAQTSEPLGTLTFSLGYDPAALKIVRIAEGNFLRQQGKKTVFTSKIEADAGRALIRTARIGPQGVTGKGNVATVTFAARTATAQSQIVITSPAAVSSAGRELPSAQSVPLVVKLVP